MTRKKLRLTTLGCSKNTVDSEHILAALSNAFIMVDDLQEVDYQLINTCGFIGDAKEESIEAILAAVEEKRQGRVGKIVVFGCLAQRYADELKVEIPEVDMWFKARGEDFEAVVKYLLDEAGAEICQDARYLTTPSHYAYLKISEGCDRRCSYCAIPYIRGAHKSVPMEDLVSEAEFLASKGVKELIVIAQDITYYGLDLYKKRCLGELLQRISKVDGIEWIRLHYSYPSSFPKDVLEEMRSNPKICAYMDIPLQHISDNVLRDMHRGHNGECIRNLVKAFKENVPDIVLRTTLIVGFPTETAKDFNELLDFVRETGFQRLGAFKYSEEEGTYAANHFPDKVSAATKKRRLEKLMAIQEEISYNYNLSRVGSEITVIVDSFTDGVLVCRSQSESPDVDGEILVKAEGPIFANLDPYCLVGEFIKVRIIGADSYDLIAECIEL